MSAPDLEKVHEGKTKIVYISKAGNDIYLEFKDSITAFDGEKMDLLPGKGRINADLTKQLFSLLERHKIPTHLIELKKPNLMRVKKLKMIPLEVVCRNVAAGHFVKRLTMFKRGEPLKEPVVEFYLKDDALHDPMLVDDHIIILGHANQKEINRMKAITKHVNKVLKDFFAKRALILADFKLEFGRDSKGRLVLGDELSADSMRLWDERTGAILDKDVYREGKTLDEVLEVYEECHRRVVGGT